MSASDRAVASLMHYSEWLACWQAAHRDLHPRSLHDRINDEAAEQLVNKFGLTTSAPHPLRVTDPAQCDLAGGPISSR